MLLSFPPPAPLRCARTFCRRSRYLSKEPALVLNNTRVPTKLLCPLRRRGQRGPLTHRPCPLWKITSTALPASAQIPRRVSASKRTRGSISNDNRSQREKSSGLEFRTICLILLVPLPHSWSGKSEVERGRARDGSILPHHSIGTLRKDGIEVKIPATSGKVERWDKRTAACLVDLTFRLEWIPPPPPFRLLNRKIG